MVLEICRDIQSLDHAKRNLQTTITALKRLQMLVTAVGSLQLHSPLPLAATSSLALREQELTAARQEVVTVREEATVELAAVRAGTGHHEDVQRDLRNTIDDLRSQLAAVRGQVSVKDEDLAHVRRALEDAKTDATEAARATTRVEVGVPFATHAAVPTCPTQLLMCVALLAGGPRPLAGSDCQPADAAERGRSHSHKVACERCCAGAEQGV